MQHAPELCRVRMGQISNGINPHPAQLLLCGMAHQKQIPYRQRPEFRGDLPGKQRVDLIRLFKIPGDLCQQLVAGDADIHGKAKLVMDLLLHLLGRQHRIPVEPRSARHIHPGLINGKLLHQGCIGL